MSEITFLCDACDGNGDYFGPLGPDRCAKCGGNAHVARALRSALAEAEGQRLMVERALAAMADERDRLREALRASAPDAVREAAARVAALAEHQTNQHGTPFVTLWGQEGVDAMAALRRSLAAQDGGGD